MTDNHRRIGGKHLLNSLKLNGHEDVGRCLCAVVSLLPPESLAVVFGPSTLSDLVRPTARPHEHNGAQSHSPLPHAHNDGRIQRPASPPGFPSSSTLCPAPFRPLRIVGHHRPPNPYAPQGRRAATRDAYRPSAPAGLVIVVVVGGYAHRFQLHNTNHCPPNASQKARLCFFDHAQARLFSWGPPSAAVQAVQLRHGAAADDPRCRRAILFLCAETTFNKLKAPSSILNEHPSTSRQNEPESATAGGIEAVTRRPMYERGTVSHLFPSSPKSPPDLHGPMPN